MAIDLDADVVIRGERGKFDLETWLASLRQERFELAAITVAELWHGVERAKGTERAACERYLSVVLDSLPIIPYMEQIAF